MQQLENARHCYNQTARAYAGAYYDELRHKPLDRLLLRRFADEHKGKGPVADLGCGPGQTTRFLYEAGITAITGIDLSPGMIAEAVRLNPAPIRFETGNMLQLAYPDQTFGGLVAFYAIVHFTEPELAAAMAESYRVLKGGGQFLLSFHAGEQTVHLEELLQERVSIDFHFFDPDRVLDIARGAGFTVVDALVRYPYAGHEYPSRRAYLLVQK